MALLITIVYDVADKKTGIVIKADNLNCAYAVDFDGKVIIYHTNRAVINAAAERIKNIVREVEQGVKYTGKVTRVEDFGCFVEIWPGCEGMVHVSQLAWERVEKAGDIVKVGDEIIVMSQGYDNRGRLNLSRKEALPRPKKKETPKVETIETTEEKKEENERFFVK